MVLEKLSDALKNTLKKIAGSALVDKKLIDELVKDIQRALLHSDVNVQLVFELTKKIKERALNEKVPKGIDNRTHIVNIVYEELVKFLGDEKKEIKLTKKKPNKLMLVGLFGSGKCVHPKSVIPLSSGDILNAENLYRNYENSEEIIDDGKIIDVSNKKIYVPSFNPKTLKIENKKVTHLWKLKGKQLLNVYLDNKNDFYAKVTPEHPFFVLRKGKLLQIRADELNEDDCVAVPNKYNINPSLVNLFGYLKEFDLDVYGIKNAKQFLIKKFINLKYSCNKSKFKHNYCKFTMNVKNGRVPINLLDNYKNNFISLKYPFSSKKINFPIYLNEELAEFLGYFVGDGGLYKNYITISNEDKEIVERVIYLCKKLFGIKPSVKRDIRTKKMYRIVISSKTLTYIFDKLFGFKSGKKGKNLKLPTHLLISPNKVIISFLRAYFDCDGYASFNREIELVSESNILIKQISSLLKRLEIMSSIAKKFVGNIPYWRLFINARYTEIYANKVSFTVKHKLKRINNYSLIGLKQGCGKQDMIPVGKSLKLLRESLGFSIGKVQKNVESYGAYEHKGLISKESLAKVYSLYWNEKYGKMLDILDLVNKKESLKEKYTNPILNAVLSHYEYLGFVCKLEDSLVLTENGQLFLKKNKQFDCKSALGFIKNLIYSDICWMHVKKVENGEKPEFVYDLTVEDNHSFIADDIIVHNTTTAGKLGNYFKKRGKKIALIQLDVWRPAAAEQLEQLGKKLSIDVFTDKAEKDPVKVYKKFEDKFSKYDLLIVDTAGRDALSKDLIKEIEKVNKLVKPDETLLVISADIGQAAKEQTEQFHKSCKITGVIATKMDGTARAGGALSACAISGAPIKFLGVGEKLDDLEEFNPKGFVGRLLGMGDLEALLDKAKEAISEEKAEDLGRKFLKGEFNFLDLYEQLQAMSKMGPISKLMDMIPGMGGMKIPKDMLEIQGDKLKKWKFALQSMTKKELENPEIITGERIDRIAKGAGMTIGEVRELLKQYKQSKKMMKKMKGKGMEKMMKKFKGAF